MFGPVEVVCVMSHSTDLFPSQPELRRTGKTTPAAGPTTGDLPPNLKERVACPILLSAKRQQFLWIPIGACSSHWLRLVLPPKTVARTSWSWICES